MIDERRVTEAKSNFDNFLREGLLKKQTNETAKKMFIDNAYISLETAKKLWDIKTESFKPYLWIIVSSYYAMFYITNAVLLNLGYKTADKIVHKVANEALIVLIRHKLKERLLEDYEECREEAMELVLSKTDDLIKAYEYEKAKRARFQYEMAEELKEAKAQTSFTRASRFVFEMKKLLQ